MRVFLFLACTSIVCSVYSSENPSVLDGNSTQQTSMSGPSERRQVYGIATYDALFKYVLEDQSLLPSFFKAFVPGVVIESAERLDEHMNPIQKLQILRDFIHDKDTHKTASLITKSKGVQVCTKDAEKFVPDENMTAFISKFSEHFDELKSAFPTAKYDGTMDFVCRLDTSEYAMIEMQVIPQDYWDRRALAYAAAFYGNQLSKGESWKKIKRVIAINILGGGREQLPHWKETPEQFYRHYRFQEQHHRPSLYIDGIELFQYSIMNAPQDIDEQEQRDWITFFKKGYTMSEEDVKKNIKTEAVRTAFERAKIAQLPQKVQRTYEEEDKEYNRYSEHTAQKVREGKEEGIKEGEEKAKVEMIRKMILRNKTNNEILDVVNDVGTQKIEELRKDIAEEQSRKRPREQQ